APGRLFWDAVLGIDQYVSLRAADQPGGQLPAFEVDAEVLRILIGGNEPPERRALACIRRHERLRWRWRQHVQAELCREVSLHGSALSDGTRGTDGVVRVDEQLNLRTASCLATEPVVNLFRII